MRKANPGQISMKTRNFCRAVSLALSLLGVNTLAQAGSIYTGTDDKGRQSFSDRPCPADAKQSSKKPTQTTSQNQPARKPQRKATGSHGGFVNRARGVEKSWIKSLDSYTLGRQRYDSPHGMTSTATLLLCKGPALHDCW
ncbi:MAG TPA: hypothetical protein DIT58_03315 [Porticoccaceae bacterium]|nr:hypothetical protein [Porticoccaceae bacterium]